LVESSEKLLFQDLRGLIESSKVRTAASASIEMTDLYWNVGDRLNSDILANQRAEYGKEIIPKTSDWLSLNFGKGWSAGHLWHCVKLSTTFSKEVLSTLQKELNWSQIKTVMYIENPLKRDFYIEMCKTEHWSVKALQGRITSMLFERTAVSKKPEETIANDLEQLRDEKRMSPDLVFRDPYFLDYLGLHDSYSEKDLEDAILTELQRVIIEIGSDFAYLARQKRMTIDGRDYYLDLLFMHRRLRCLVAIELKIGEFEAAFKSQMELYLHWLERHEMIEGEERPIGLILCTGKNAEHIELLGLDNGNIRVAEYLTKLPNMKLLEAKLKQSIANARARFENSNSILLEDGGQTAQ